MVRPRKKEVGNVITVTMSPETRSYLDCIAKEDNRSMSEIVTGLITKEYNLRRGGEGALRILDEMANAVTIQAHFRDRQKVSIEPFIKLLNDIVAIREALPEYQKRQEEEAAAIQQSNRDVIEANKRMRTQKDKKESKK